MNNNSIQSSKHGILPLKKPPPDNRSYEQLLNHYTVEKRIADKLKISSRQERRQIYSTMYDELFEKVPDHSRLTRRNSRILTEQSIMDKLNLCKNFIADSTILGEFAPGDCEFAIDVSEIVKKVYAIDISDQSISDKQTPENFFHVIYDGYNLEEKFTDMFDVIFSDQLLEHFHPDDTRSHLELVYRVLKRNGYYIFRTPHAFSGPHDISQYFSNTPECFHLKEWTYNELNKMLKNIGYRRIRNYRIVKGILLNIPTAYNCIIETLLRHLPYNTKRFFSRYLIESIVCVAKK